MRNQAVIDLGSNNVLLLIAHLESERIVPLKRLNRISALARDMKDEKLSEEGILRAFNIIKDYVTLAGKLNADIHLLATSAAREAANIAVLRKKISSELKLEMKIISGFQEARYNGVANMHHFPADSLLLFDIGGGSTEFTYIHNGEITAVESLNLGIWKLRNLFGDDIRSCLEYIQDILMKNSITIPSGCIFTGIGGTVTSLAAILQGLQHYDENKIHGYRIKIEEVKTLREKLQQMETKEVEQLIPFNPIPANLLLTGITLVIEIIAYFKTEAFFVSDRTWQFGVLEEIKQEMTEND